MGLVIIKQSTTRYCFYFTILILCFTTIVILSRSSSTSRFYSNVNKQYPSKYPYIGLIVDDRATQQVINAVFNVLKYIPTDWKIQMMIPTEHWPFYNVSSLSPLIIENRVFLTPLDFPRVDFTGPEFINLLLTSASFWHHVQGEKVLYFQIDSVICSNSSYKLMDFLEYDFIGAPWPDGGCCNGGFSLRSRTKMLQLFESHSVRYQLHETNEDVWLYRHLSHFNGRIAPSHVAKKFSVEAIYSPKPFAVHKPNLGRLGAKNMKRLCEDCSEVRTISSHC